MVQATVMIQVPLTPQVMQQAGVPLEDALWLTRLPQQQARTRALRTTRGENIIARVRRFAQQVTLSDASSMRLA